MERVGSKGSVADQGRKDRSVQWLQRPLSGEYKSGNLLQEHRTLIEKLSKTRLWEEEGHPPGLIIEITEDNCCNEQAFYPGRLAATPISVERAGTLVVVSDFPIITDEEIRNEKLDEEIFKRIARGGIFFIAQKVGQITTPEQAKKLIKWFRSKGMTSLRVSCGSELNYLIVGGEKPGPKKEVVHDMSESVLWDGKLGAYDGVRTKIQQHDRVVRMSGGRITDDSERRALINRSTYLPRDAKRLNEGAGVTTWWGCGCYTSEDRKGQLVHVACNSPDCQLENNIKNITKPIDKSKNIVSPKEIKSPPNYLVRTIEAMDPDQSRGLGKDLKELMRSGAISENNQVSIRLLSNTRIILQGGSNSVNCWSVIKPLETVQANTPDGCRCCFVCLLDKEPIRSRDKVLVRFHTCQHCLDTEN